MWDSFKLGYCKVQFLCYEGDLNWLGWVVLVAGLWFSFLFLAYMIEEFVA